MKTSSFLLCLLVLCGCSTIEVTHDYDKTVDFTRFKTYAYAPEALQLPIQELNRNRLIAAVDREMSARGFAKSESPDVLVDLIVRTAQKQEAIATTSGPGFYGRGYGYGMGFTTTRVDVNT